MAFEPAWIVACTADMAVFYRDVPGLPPFIEDDVQRSGWGW
ncbi:hypothetical protein [Labrys wisconsinensis]|uniref:Uncharacterized protein n=1 Tax=Labrys wisconsinensis TaxID=425677 RepID=A0ABU0JL78_9HYPH|nr:hypothetical protein [Labrys wisconsinensis]MDQ0475028.1 hypothetical protein [Labrys wisconsinensis]